jgi:opacity protein-like surface antigen
VILKLASSTSASVVLGKYYDWSNHLSGWGGSVVAIGGYAFGDFLPYAKGGVAWIEDNYRLTPIYSAVSTTVPGTSQTIGDLGWTLGAGLAYHVSSNWEVFGQYACTRISPLTTSTLLSGPSAPRSPSIRSLRA